MAERPRIDKWVGDYFLGRLDSITLLTRQEDFAKDLGLSGQIQRVAVSVISNIAEGFGRGGSAAAGSKRL